MGVWIGLRLAALVRHPRTRKIAIWCVAIVVTIGIIVSVAPPLLRNKKEPNDHDLLEACSQGQFREAAFPGPRKLREHGRPDETMTREYIRTQEECEKKEE